MTKQNQAASNQQPAGQPLFYRNPIPLLLNRHQDAGITKEESYNFAKATNSVPLNVQEFGEACKYYPIAFTNDSLAVPVAILGMEDKKNLFVNKTGEWKSGAYIPAYVRRYPFAFSTSQGNENLILCVDEGSERFVQKAKKNDMKLFDNREQTQLTQNALNFCSQYHNDFLLTQDFSRSLLGNNLLVEKQVNVTLQNGKQVSLSGLRVIDEEKLQNLDDDVVKQWHKNGMLALIYFQLLSGSNWQKLADLMNKGL